MITLLDNLGCRSFHDLEYFFPAPSCLQGFFWESSWQSYGNSFVGNCPFLLLLLRFSLSAVTHGFHSCASSSSDTWLSAWPVALNFRSWRQAPGGKKKDSLFIFNLWHFNHDESWCCLFGSNLFGTLSFLDLSVCFLSQIGRFYFIIF